MPGLLSRPAILRKSFFNISKNFNPENKPFNEIGKKPKEEEKPEEKPKEKPKEMDELSKILSKKYAKEADEPRKSTLELLAECSKNKNVSPINQSKKAQT